MKIAYKVALASVLAGGSHVAVAQHTQVFTAKDKHYHEGVELFDRAKYGAAQEAFRKYINLIGDDAKTADATAIRFMIIRTRSFTMQPVLRDYKKFISIFK